MIYKGEHQIIKLIATSAYVITSGRIEMAAKDLW